jgi:8-oxo-dGTP diphosphatase
MKRAEMRAAVYLILQAQDQTLLARRCNTGYQDGNYSLVAGHVEAGESVTEALIREAREEIGITVAAQDLEFVHLLHRRAEDDLTYFDFFFAAHRWQGEVTNCEPHKCDDLRWFPLAALPANLIAYVRDVLTHFQLNGDKFSEYGWLPPAGT